jgi:hypothetical protein
MIQEISRRVDVLRIRSSKNPHQFVNDGQVVMQFASDYKVEGNKLPATLRHSTHWNKNFKDPTKKKRGSIVFSEPRRLGLAAACDSLCRIPIRHCIPAILRAVSRISYSYGKDLPEIIKAFQPHLTIAMAQGSKVVDGIGDNLHHPDCRMPLALSAGLH